MTTTNQIIQSSLGDIGRWQITTVLLMAFLKFPVAWTLLGLVFMGAKMPFKCANGPDSDPCVTFSNQKCTNFTYNRTVFRETISSEWNLVCDKSQLVNVAQMTFMIGIMFGSILFSIASDRWGRKLPLVIAGILQVITGVCVAFIPWYAGFVLLRFLQALAVGGCMTISFVLTMELLNGRWRTIMAGMTHIPFNLGTIIMAGIAYLTRNWRDFQLSISLPTIIIIAYWWLIPESPRWLLAVKKNKKALALLQEAAKANNNPIPEKIPETSDEDETEGNKANFLDLFRTPNMRKKTLIIWFNWIVVGFCFFGLEQYISQMGGDIFINVALSGACMLPGVLLSIYTMDKFGRKPTLLTGQVTSAACCLVIVFLPTTWDWTRVAFAEIGVAGTGIAFTTLYLYSTELFPTVVRNTGLGSGSMCARIGSMLAPFAASLESVAVFLPPAMFGFMSSLAAVLCIFLPETLNTVLPTSIEDGETFGLKEFSEKEIQN